MPFGPMNPNCYHPETDDEIYRELYLTQATSQFFRSKTLNPRKEADEHDDQFFLSNPHRLMFIRLSFPNEFDHVKYFNLGPQPPQLWVRVQKLPNGCIEVVPCWRGNCFWKDCDSDASTADLHNEMQKRGGINLLEWFMYVFDKRERNRYEKSVQSRKRKKGGAR
jgi:hypothetical protein